MLDPGLGIGYNDKQGNSSFYHWGTESLEDK